MTEKRYKKLQSELFEQLCTAFSKGKNNDQLGELIRAYRFACRIHKDKLRKTKEPFIFHPLRAALNLAKIEVEPEVIIATLLHDVLEEKGEKCSVSDLKEKFSPNVVDLVRTVTKEHNHLNDPFLMSGNSMYISLATELDNLQTMECYSEKKKREKILNTRNTILDCVNTNNSEYFVNQIYDAFFKIENESLYNKIFNNQCFLLREYENSINYLSGIFRELEIAENNAYWNSVIKVDISRTLPIQIKYYDEDFLFHKYPKKELTPNKLWPVLDILIVYSSKYSTDDEIMNEFLSFFKTRLYKSDFTITCICAKRVPEQMPYLILENKDKINFRVILYSESVYKERFFGLNMDFSKFDSNASANPEILVYSRSGQTFYIERGATIHDFAFFIHSQLGFTAEYALVKNINDNNTKRLELSEKIEENMHIQIIRGETNNADLEWFHYLSTKNAKNCLIKHFKTQNWILKRYFIKDILFHFMR